MASLNIRQTTEGVIITVKVVPASSKTAVAGVLDGALKIKIAAQPEKGKANRQLIEFMAGRLGIRKKDVTILAGKTNPVKQIQISNVVTADIERAFELKV